MNRNTSKEERAEAKKEREKREKRELREKRERQLAEAENAAETLEGRLKSTISAERRCEVLLDHSKGFYGELDKLAKGRTLFEVTNLVLEQANNIIRDAKEIAEGDIYLDRIKQFVPAGNNPVYPDVLVSTRVVRDGIGRFRKILQGRLVTLKANLCKAETVIVALTYFLDDSAGSEEERNFPSRENVELYMDGNANNSCFSSYRNTDEEYFDFEKLDRQPIAEYLSVSETDEANEDAADTEEEKSGVDSADLDTSDRSEKGQDEEEDTEV
ncbi:MAG: hypothetical protein LAN71_00290 [Acidobacteriia bacterium]|nr:hypothetical protein [Terriglobia bacterium]